MMNFTEEKRMHKSSLSKLKDIALVLVMAIVIQFAAATVNAGTAQISEQTGVFLTDDLDSDIITSVDVELNQSLSQKEAIEGIKAVRSRQYDKNPWVPNGSGNNIRLRDFVAQAGYADKDAYVNDVRWDSSLEKIAIQRVLETYVHGQIAHARTSKNTDVFNARIGNIGPSAEVIAWAGSMKNGILLWETEEKDLPSSETAGYEYPKIGHLLYMIIPNKHSFGLANLGGISLGVSSRLTNPDSTGTNWNGSFTFGIAIDKAKYNTVEQSTETQDIPVGDIEVIENAEQYIGYEKILVEPKAGEKQIQTIAESFAGHTSPFNVKTVETITRPVENGKKEVGTKPLPEPKVVETEIPFQKLEQNSADLYIGQKEQKQAGINGLEKTVTTYTANKEGILQENTEKVVIREAIDQITLVGTKALPENKVETTQIPYETIKENNANLYKGVSQVRQAGQNGKRVKTIKYEIVNNKLVEQVLSDVTTDPVSEIIQVGTKPLPEPKVEEREKAYQKVQEKTASLYVGQTELKQQGSNGREKVTTSYTADQNNKLIEHIKTEVLRPAVDEITLIGTKALPENEVTETKIPFESVKEKNKDLYTGYSKTVQNGIDGKRVVVKGYKIVNNQLEQEIISDKTYGAVKEIIQVGTKPLPEATSEEVSIAFKTIKKNDNTLKIGEEKIAVKGVNGRAMKHTSYSVNSSTGELIDHVELEEISAPVDQIILVGTKAPTQTTEATKPSGNTSRGSAKPSKTENTTKSSVGQSKTENTTKRSTESNKTTTTTKRSVEQNKTQNTTKRSVEQSKTKNTTKRSAEKGKADNKPKPSNELNKVEKSSMQDKANEHSKAATVKTGTIILISLPFILLLILGLVFFIIRRKSDEDY